MCFHKRPLLNKEDIQTKEQQYRKISGLNSLGLCKSLPPFWHVNYWQELRCCLAGHQWHCFDLPLSQESPQECDVCRPGCFGWSCWRRAGHAAHRPFRSDWWGPSGSPWRGGTGWMMASFAVIFG
jgi:hypothetical protein